jgi:hypothetical protein
MTNDLANSVDRGRPRVNRAAAALGPGARRRLTILGVLVAVMACASAADARSRQPNDGAHTAAFDGRWSVMINTESGACDRSSRVGVDIVNGAVTYGGTAYGRVNGSGALRVSVVMGDQQAQGAGRLRRGSGRGAWQGFGHQGTCSGKWTAERFE